MLKSGSVTRDYLPGLRLSDEIFWRPCRANPDLDLERATAGDLIVMAPAVPDSERGNLGLAAQSWSWNEASGPGVAFGPSAGFTPPCDTLRNPDAPWMALERRDALSREDREAFSRICPHLDDEVRPRSDPLGALPAKMAEYVGQGARLAWLIDPRIGRVEVDRPGRPSEVLERPMTLSGEDVLPGFVLDLRGILDFDRTRPGDEEDDRVETRAVTPAEFRAAVRARHPRSAGRTTMPGRRRADWADRAGLGRVSAPEGDAPTIVVEFASASRHEGRREYEEKPRESPATGVKEYWIIDHFRRIMAVDRNDPVGLATSGMKEGETYRIPVLPGSDLPSARLLARADLWPKTRRQRRPSAGGDS